MAQIFIDGVEQTSGQLAAFGEDGLISALDADGTSYFPPSDINIYRLKSFRRSRSFHPSPPPEPTSTSLVI